MVDVLTLNYNDAETTCKFIRSVRNFKSVNRIVVVDNNSTDNSIQVIKDELNEREELVLSFINGGYGAGNNIGIQYLSEKYNSEYILLSNPDVIVDEETVAKLEYFLSEHKDYSIVAPFMCDHKGEKQQNTAFRIPTKWEYIISMSTILQKTIRPLYYHNIRNEELEYKQVGNVSGAMFLMRVPDMLKHGMYDENIFLFCEEMIIGLKMKQAGCKVALIPALTFIHNHSVSISKSFDSEVKKQKLLVKSKLYVIYHYFNANMFEYIVAKVLGWVSILETWIIVKIRG